MVRISRYLNVDGIQQCTNQARNSPIARIRRLLKNSPRTRWLPFCRKPKNPKKPLEIDFFPFFVKDQAYDAMVEIYGPEEGV